MNKLLRLAGASAIATLVTSTVSVSVVGAQDSFEGKTIRVLIGFGAGGGYDRYGRQVARHIGKHLPGKPAVVAVNMPGAGGMKLVNYLYNVAPKNGTSFGTFARGAPLFAFAGRGKSNQVRPAEANQDWDFFEL